MIWCVCWCEEFYRRESPHTHVADAGCVLRQRHSQNVDVVTDRPRHAASTGVECRNKLHCATVDAVLRQHVVVNELPPIMRDLCERVSRRQHTAVPHNLKVISQTKPVTR
jgi:hypothetical protein